jgi:hypothetical protein
VFAACSDDQRSTLQTMVANPAADNAQAVAMASPEGTLPPAGFTLLATPTLDPIANGPLGTWTAIAQTIAPPTPDPRQYEIVNRGVPHFIEFHAWW